MMHLEEDFLLVDKEVNEERGREGLQVKEEAVGGGDELFESDTKPSDIRVVPTDEEDICRSRR